MLPRRGLWSGVKLSGPQIVDLMPVRSRTGKRFIALCKWTPNTSQSSSYKLKTESLGIFCEFQDWENESLIRSCSSHFLNDSTHLVEEDGIVFVAAEREAIALNFHGDRRIVIPHVGHFRDPVDPVRHDRRVFEDNQRNRNVGHFADVSCPSAWKKIHENYYQFD